MGKSAFTDDVWNNEIGPRYRDERETTGKVMADQLGIHESTLTSQMRRRNFLRNVPRPDVPLAAQPDPDAAEMAELMRFDFDPDRPVESIREVLGKARRASNGGRLGLFRELMRCAGMIRREALPALPEPAADRPDMAPRADLVLRRSQQPPEGSWSTWLFLGGRGAGKTLAGATWLADAAERNPRLALVGVTLHDVREVMIGGPSGLLTLPRWAGGERPVYEPSRRRLVFPNGAHAHAFSAEDPDSLRGPQFGAAWADEFCAWSRPDETLAMLRLGLRLGDDPRLVVTTTPRPLAALRGLRDEAGCVVTHAPTRENLVHLAPGFLKGLTALYGGTRREAQELEGLMIEAEGGLFRAADLARARMEAKDAPTRFDRVVVAIDPTTTPGGDACGIVVAARSGDRAFVLADRSMAGLTPDGWARRAIRASDEFAAACIVAEVNQGGDMVGCTLRTARPDVRLREVRATTGKRIRAEPVAALYEQGRVRHLGLFRELEEELMALGGIDEKRSSLDRADALVWAITDLLLTPRSQGPSIRRL